LSVTPTPHGYCATFTYLSVGVAHGLEIYPASFYASGMTDTLNPPKPPGENELFVGESALTMHRREVQWITNFADKQVSGPGPEGSFDVFSVWFPTTRRQRGSFVSGPMASSRLPRRMRTRPPALRITALGGLSWLSDSVWLSSDP
jgi:hypothetical protein